MSESVRPRPRNRAARSLARAAACLALAVLPAAAALAQNVNPVYLDDSTRSRDALTGLPALIGSGNLAEAVRTLQDLLESEGGRVIESPSDPDLFVDVRQRIFEAILATPELAAAYREAQEPIGRRLLAEGKIEEVERTRWVTRAGLEACLRLVQRDIENARFEAARIGLLRAERHPDAADPALAGPAHELATLLASYLPRQDVEALAIRAAARAGRAFQPPAPAQWPDLALSTSANPTTHGPTLDLAQLDRRSAQAVRLAPESARPQQPQPASNNGRAQPEVPWVMPAVTGDLVLVNDGEYLSAWDRFTLAMKWRIRPPTAQDQPAEVRLYGTPISYRQSMGAGLEDASFITTAGPVALATTGLARNGLREGDPRLHAVEVESGRLLWSVDVPSLDLALTQGSVRGPALVDADTIVLCVRTYIQFRRLQTVAMVGLDLHDGSLKWSRQIASAGMLPYRRPTAVADLGVVADGVVYRVDELGVITALEAGTGRTVWIRRMLSVSGPPESGEPWAMSAPIVTDRHVIVLSPDHRDVLRLDRATGAIVGRRGADVLGWPRYILRAGNYLVCAGINRIAFAPLDEFETGQIRSSPNLPPPSIGRAVVSGDRILAPVGGGVAIIDPANPGRPLDDTTLIPLPRRGIILPATSQLLLADNDRLRSFLIWPEALERLRAQVEASPSDPVPALTLARLAARAGEWRLLTPALDRCLDTLDADPDRPDAAAIRADLFSFVLEAVRHARSGQPDDEIPMPPPVVAAELLKNLERAAREPTQRLAHLMEKGTAQELVLDHAAACQTYQQVLAQPALAAAMWSEGVQAVRGSIEASQRLQRLVAAQGLAIYEPFEQSARREHDGLGDRATIDALRALASQYPVATITPSLWLRAARGLAEQGKPIESLAALFEAQASGQALARAGAVADNNALPEAIGLALSRLDGMGEPAWALATLDRVLAEFPAMVPTVEGVVIDVAGTRAALADRASPLPALPAIGPDILSDARFIAARTPLRPLLGAAPTDAVLLGAVGSGRIELWRRTETGLAIAWEKDSVSNAPPALISIDADRVVLFVPQPGRDGPTIECLSRADGALLWRTPGFETLFPPDPDLQARFIAAQSQGATITTPIDGQVRLDDLLCTHDGRTLILAERSGRTASFDMRDGATLWARHLDLAQIHDLAVLGHRLALGGAFLHPVGPDSVQTTLGPVLLLLDARTGDLLARHDDAAAPDEPRALGEVRWVKIAPDATILAGLRLGIGALRLDSGQHVWRAEGSATASTLDAWIDADRLWMLGADRGLRLLDLATGELMAGALPSQGRTGSRRPIRLTRLEGRVVLTSGRGVVILDRDGGLLGVDAIDRQDTLLPPAVGSPHIALLDAAPRRDAAAPAYRLSLVNTTSAREAISIELLLDAPPTGIQLIDGHILISTPAGVTVLPAPVP